MTTSATNSSSDDLESSTNLLSEVSVVEIADTLGAYCGRFLASLGAHVVLVEPPGGCRLRRDIESPDLPFNPSFAWFHTGKGSREIDPKNADDMESLARLIGDADVLIKGPESYWLEGLDFSPQSLSKNYPSLVVASVSPFGSFGPYHNYRATESVNFAMSGLMNISGEPNEPPVLAPMDQSMVVGGIQGAVGILIALWEREQSGLGQEVEVSVQEAFCAQENIVSGFTGDNWRGERTGSQHRVATPGRIYPCKDGYVHLFVSPVQKGAWQRLVEWMGSAAEILSQEEWSNPRYRRSNVEILDEIVRRWTKGWCKQDFYIEAQNRHIPCAPVNSMSDFIEDPHIVERGFFQQFSSEAGPSYLSPGPVVLVNGRRRTGEQPAPECGSENPTGKCS